MADANLAEHMEWRRNRRYVTAQVCAGLGWCVFPWAVVNGQKRPRIKGWTSGAATTELEIIEQWWGVEGQGHFAHEVGIATGACSGIWVLDIDRHSAAADGFRTLAGLEAIYNEPLPRTFTVRTPSGGQHRYFTYPADGREIWTKADTLGPGLDTRGWHGFVAAPDSENGRGRYEIMDDWEPVAAPRWLEDMAERKRGAKEPVTVQLRGGPSDFYGWVNECAAVVTRQEGHLFTGLCRMQSAGLPDEVMRLLARQAVARFPQTKSEPWTPEDADYKAAHVAQHYPKGALR